MREVAAPALAGVGWTDQARGLLTLYISDRCKWRSFCVNDSRVLYVRINSDSVVLPAS